MTSVSLWRQVDFDCFKLVLVHIGHVVRMSVSGYRC